MIRRICVFCGASTGNKDIYRESAYAFGKLLAEKDLGLVYGGGNIGLMRAVADGALEAGGEVIGVIPRSLADKEIAHSGLSELHLVDTMHQRKAMMADLSDAVIALPGGWGTLDEFCEILTWDQLEFINKPVGILNIRNYFNKLLELFSHAVSEGFLQQQHLDRVIVEDDSRKLLQRIVG